MASVTVYDTQIPAHRIPKVTTIKDPFEPSKEDAFESWYMQITSVLSDVATLATRLGRPPTADDVLDIYGFDTSPEERGEIITGTRD